MKKSVKPFPDLIGIKKKKKNVVVLPIKNATIFYSFKEYPALLGEDENIFEVIVRK